MEVVGQELMPAMLARRDWIDVPILFDLSKFNAAFCHSSHFY
ncbi:hypothetical protein AH4AK4_1322 [Aeromonas hydrophila 4AK4]|nr:hypothetical protein AH4AK4_1322 [Aeromonas hydrophila 4AK4]